MLQMRPTAWKTSVLPSGEMDGHRITLARKLSPLSSACVKWTVRDSGTCTLALKGMFVVLPLPMSIEWIFPP
jgi:hypothetical protein